MKRNLSLSRLLGSKEFYPNEKLSSKLQYAKRIGRKRLKQFASLFLSPVKQSEDLILEELIAQWFTFNGTHTYKKSPAYVMMTEQLRKIRRFHPRENLHLVSTEALLNLHLWVQANPYIPDEVEEDASATIDLFNINLLFNDDVLVNYEKATKIARINKGDNYLQRLTVGMSFSQGDLINIDYVQLFYTQFYKAIRLLDFMETTPKYQLLLKEFLTDFRTTKEQFIRRLGLAIILGTKGQDGWNMLVVPKDDLYEENCFFLDKVAITPDYPVKDEQDDYLSLRSRPIERWGNGEYFVFFSLFLIKKLYTVTTFLLSDLQQKRPELLKSGFFGAIRMDFSEEVLLYDVLNKYYQQPDVVRLTGTTLKAAGLNREPDYYLRLDNTILLHESKDFFMPGDVKLSYDFEKIETLLKTDGKNAEPPKPDRLGKAVIQIVANIERVIIHQIPNDTAYDPAAIEIFPVIVVYDSLYSSAGLNFWVHFWMEEELQTLKAKPEFKDYDFSRIHPLTLVEIDTLIFYETYFSNGMIDYIELLRVYHQTVNYRMVDIEDVSQFAAQSSLSFAVFVEDYCINRQLPLDFTKLNELLISYGIN